MGGSLDHFLTKVLQLVGDRPVVDGVADAEDSTADEARVDVLLENGLAAELDAQVFGHVLQRLGGERPWRWSAARRCDCGSLSYSSPVWRWMARKQSKRPCRATHLEEVDQRGRDAARQHAVDHRRLFFGRNEDRGQNVAELRVLVDHFGHHGIELFQHRRRLAGLLRGVQQGLGVDVGNMLNADVGLDLGRGAGVFGGNVFASAMNVIMMNAEG